MEQSTPEANGVAKSAPDRCASASGLVRRWVGSDAFDTLLATFGGTRRAPVPRLDGQVAWLGGDSSGFLVDVTPGDHDLLSVLAIEEFGDFCWNFRQGLPRGVTHLLRCLSSPADADRLGSALPALADRERWGTRAGLAELMSVYTGEPVEPGHGDVIQALIARLLPAASADRRADLEDRVRHYPMQVRSGYQERWEAIRLRFSREAAALVHEAAATLGLVNETQPVAREYDHVVVLGGGGLSPLLRTQYAREVLDAHGVSTQRVWLLGSPRPIDQSHEGPIVASYASGARTEFDLMVASLQAVFDVRFGADTLVCGCVNATSHCPAWRQRLSDRFDGETMLSTPSELQHDRQLVAHDDRGREFFVISAGTSNPPNRPNTADTYVLLAKLARFRPGQRVLIVTTQVFVPFQGFDAVRMLQLPYGIEADIIGFGAARGDRPETPEFLLQEILSGVRSARRLAVACADNHCGGG